MANDWVTITEEDEWETIPETGFRGAGATGTWTELTTIQKAGQAIKEVAAAPVRTIESMAGGLLGGIARMGAEAPIGSVITKHIDMPGVGVVAEHLIRKYGPDKALSFYDRKMKKHADSGKKISDFWAEQANKGWEAPNPDMVEARWRDRPVSKTVSAVSSGLTSIGVVLGTTYLTKSPQVGLATLAASETGGMYNRLRDKDVPPDIASKLAQMAGAWTYATEKIGFDRLLKPGAKTIMAVLRKGGWEGLQEVVETMGHNLLEYFGYDYRKPEDIPTAVKAAFDHIMDDWQDALVGGIGAGGLTHLALRPGVRPGEGIYKGKAYRVETGSPKPSGETAGDVIRFEQEELANDLGITPEKIIELNKRSSRDIVWVARNKETARWYGEEVEDVSDVVQGGEIITEMPDGVLVLKQTGPITTPPTIEELTKKPIEEIEPQTPDHVIGHQYGLTNEQVDNKLNEAELRYRELKLKATPVSVKEELFWIKNKITGESKQVSNKEYVDKYLEDTNWLIGRPKDIRTPEESDELSFLSRNRSNIEAILERETQPVTPPPIKRTQKNLLALGHKIARQAELTDEEYRDLAEIVTGKRSMKDMSKTERNEFVSALEESYGVPKELLPEDYDMPINVAGRATSMREIYGEVIKTLETLIPRRKIPAVIEIGFGTESMRQRAKNFAVGIDNTPVYHLARKLDSGIEGIFSEVLDKGIQYGVETANGHGRQVTEALLNRLQELGVTDNDLAKMGRSVNPRLRTHQMISEGAATETFVETINGQDYKMTWANLIHIYLYANQEAGMQHLLGGGLVIHGNMTDKISKERINDIQRKVEKNPKAKAVVDTILEIGELIWKPSINMVSQRIEGKEIATEPNWFGLRVYMPPKIAGKIRIGKMGQFGVNFIEDKGMFKDRTKSTLPLIVGDVFSEFSSFENATADYVGMAEASRTSRTLLNNPDIATILDQKGYGRVRHHILAIHKQAQSLPVSEGNFSAFFAKHLPALYRAVLHFNPRLVASQKTSTFNYGACVSPKYMKNIVAGLGWKNIQRTLRLSNIAWDRFHMAHSSLELGEMAQSDSVLRMWTGGKSSDINKMGWAIKMADGSALADGMVMAWDEYQDARNDTIEGLSTKWWANKDVNNMPEMNIEMWEEIQAKEENATPEERQTAEQWKQLITKRAEYLWQRTQPSWDKWNRSYLTSQKGLRRIYLLFRSFHEKSLTIFNEAKLDYDHSPKSLDNKAIFAQKAGSVLTGYAVNKFLRLAMAALLYRERKSLVKIGEEFLTSWMDMFPVFGKALKITVNKFIDTLMEEKTSYVGEALEAFPVRVVNMILKAPPDMAEATAHLLKGENKEAEEAFMRGIGRLAENVGMLYGVPVPEIKRVLPKEEEEPVGRRGPVRRAAPAKRKPK